MVQKIVSKADFDQLAAGEKTVVIDFSAVWCGPCKLISPHFHKLESAFPDLVFIEVDVDESGDIASAFDVRAMPTFVAVKGGKEIGRVTGASPPNLKKLLEDASKA